MLTLRTQIILAGMTLASLVMSLCLLAVVFNVVGVPDMRIVAAHYAHIHQTTIAERK